MRTPCKVLGPRPTRVATRQATEWEQSASCRPRQRPGEKLVVDVGFYTTDPRRIWKAQEICYRCPVLGKCLADVRNWPDDLRDVGMVMGGVYWPPRRQNLRNKARKRSKKASAINDKEASPPAQPVP